MRTKILIMVISVIMVTLISFPVGAVTVIDELVGLQYYPDPDPNGYLTIVNEVTREVRYVWVPGPTGSIAVGDLFPNNPGDEVAVAGVTNEGFGFVGVYNVDPSIVNLQTVWMGENVIVDDIAIGDFSPAYNGDELALLVGAGDSTGFVYFITLNAAPPWPIQTLASLQVNDTPMGIAAGDLYNDAGDELAVAAYGGYGIKIYYNIITGSQQTEWAHPLALAIGDLLPGQSKDETSLVRLWNEGQGVSVIDHNDSTRLAISTTTVWVTEALNVAVGNLLPDIPGDEMAVVASEYGGLVKIIGNYSTGATLNGVEWFFPVDVAVGNMFIENVVDIDPDTLNLKSKGQWVTAYIYDKDGITPLDVASAAIVEINWEKITPIAGIIKEDNVKFDRQALIGVLEPGPERIITITGKTTDGQDFLGYATIKVIRGSEK